MMQETHARGNFRLRETQLVSLINQGEAIPRFATVFANSEPVRLGCGRTLKVNPLSA